MGHVGEASRSAKPSGVTGLALHLELNPVRNAPVLVGIDRATGQTFLVAPRGLATSRDAQARRRRIEMGLD